jgi:ABC-type polysaccharide/polyol phosphate export permease
MSTAAIEAPGLDRDVSLSRRAARELRDLWAFRPLVRYLVTSSLRTETASTVLGFLWWILDPLLLMAVYYIFIAIILRVQTPHFPMYVLTAIIAWEFFVKSVTKSMLLTLGKEESMRQVAFPRSAIPLAATLTEACHFLFAVGVLLLLLPLFGLEPGPMALLVFPLGLLLFVFTLGVSLLLSSAYVFFRDMKNLTEHGFYLWFHICPALWLITRFPPQYRGAVEANPFATLFEDLRSVLMYDQLPATSLIHLAVLCAGAVLTLAIGFVCFVKGSQSFAKVS